MLVVPGTIVAQMARETRCLKTCWCKLHLGGDQENKVKVLEL
jgi:hypothetical protein